MKSQSEIENILKSLRFPAWGFPEEIPHLNEYSFLIGDVTKRLGMVLVTYSAAKDKIIESMPPGNPHEKPKHLKKIILGTLWEYHNHLIESAIIGITCAVENLYDGIKYNFEDAKNIVNETENLPYNEEVQILRKINNVIKHDGGQIYSTGGRSAKSLINDHGFPEEYLPANSMFLFSFKKTNIVREVFHAWIFSIALLDHITKNQNPWLKLSIEEQEALMFKHLVPDILNLDCQF